jgi:hypothetical protein
MDKDEVLRQLREATAGGLAQWARDHNVPHSVVSEVLRGLRHPSPQILAALRLRLVKSYEKTDHDL